MYSKSWLKPKEKEFTLIELLIVISIIGLLASVLIRVSSVKQTDNPTKDNNSFFTSSTNNSNNENTINLAEVAKKATKKAINYLSKVNVEVPIDTNRKENTDTNDVIFDEVIPETNSSPLD